MFEFCSKLTILNADRLLAASADNKEAEPFFEKDMSQENCTELEQTDRRETR